MNYIRRFSATEKAVFGALVAIACIAAFSMAWQVRAMLTVEVPARGGSLREGAIGLPRDINPVLAVTDVDSSISALVYSGLMREENGNLVPDLASSYSVSPDGLTYAFTLKDGLHFQDGSPLTADDVVFTVQKIQDAALKSPLRADWQNISAAASSTDVVVFTLKQPYAPFLSNTTVGILPKHLWGGLSDDQFSLSQLNIEPVGSGPYQESSISRDSGGIPTSYSLVPWKGYYGQAPHIGSIVFSFFPDQDKALSALDSGSIDSLPSVPPDAASRLASDSAQPYTIATAPLPRIFGVFFNQNQAPVLADKNVRAALDMTAPRQAIVDQALYGYGVPIDGPLPVLDPSSASSASSTAAQQPSDASTSIAAAQALLEKNGWKKDPVTGIYQNQPKGAKSATALSFDIYTADAPDLKEAADLLKSAWTALGAQVSVKVFEPSDLYQNVIRPRKYDALLFGEFIGQDRDLYAFWHSSERNSPGLNIAMYANSKADKILESIRTASDDATRASLYSQFANVIAADDPAVFLYSPDFIYAIPRSLHNVDLSGINVPSDRFANVTDWYMDTERVWKIFARR